GASDPLVRPCEGLFGARQAVTPALTAPQCAILIARCELHGLREQLVPLHALHARLLARQGDAHSAETSLGLAEQALQLGEIGAVTPLAGLWRAQALQTLGRATEAARAAQRSAAWL